MRFLFQLRQHESQHGVRQVLSIEIRKGTSADRLDIAMQSRWAWHFWYNVFARASFGNLRGMLVSYRMNEGRWRRRYMRVTADMVAFIKLKLVCSFCFLLFSATTHTLTRSHAASEDVAAVQHASSMESM